MYYFILDNQKSTDYSFAVTKRPNIPAPKKDYNEYSIPGRNGKLYEDLETYNDIQLKIDCNYISNIDLWHMKWIKIKKWLLKRGLRKLTLSDNFDFYFIVKKIELSDNEREVKESGKFTITFTCEAFQYLKKGLFKYSKDEVGLNHYEKSYPQYIIEGDGICTLTVNDHECTCNVAQNLTIDTYLKLSYRKDGTLQNTSISADYEDLSLLEGKNKISIYPDTFNLKIIPNWRCI